MSVYQTSVDAYRDTTKWLAALTPVTTVVSAVVVAGGPVGASLAAATDKGAWFGAHWPLVVSAVVILVSIGAVLVVAARVLSQEPVQVITLQTADAKVRQSLETAFSNGIASPDFLSEAEFRQFATDVFAGGATPEDWVRLRAGHDAVREWRLFVDTKAWFTRFLWAMGAGAALVCAAIAVALTQVDSSSPVTEPTRVAVVIDADDVAGATAATGCTDVAGAEFWAIGGTWAAPTLTVSGPGCTFGARWSPGGDQAVVLPMPVG